MPSKRQVDAARSAAAPSDLSLWHLGAGLLLVGGALGATVGLPVSPWSADRLMWSVQTGLSAPGRLFTLAEALRSGAVPGGSVASSLPSAIDLELFFRSPSATQLGTAAAALSWIAWLLWLWLLGTTLLRVVVVVADRAGAGGRRVARLRAISDRVTLSIVKQAVDATLAGEMFLRAVAPASTPVTLQRMDYAVVQSTGGAEPRLVPCVPAVRILTMAPELGPGDVLYRVQPGDTLWTIAERFYGDPWAFKRIVDANLGREQPGGRTLRDARFISPGWQLVVPEPTQDIEVDADGHRWYTVRAGDTLWDISARLLGDAQRYPELFADNQDGDLGDGHVLTDPNLIWPGLRLRLPADPSEGDVAESPPSGPPPTPTPTAGSAPTPISDEPPAQPPAESEPNHGVEPAADGQAELTPVVVPPTVAAPGQVRPTPDGEPPDHLPSWVPADLEADLGIAGGLAGMALVAVAARRRRRTPPQPESDTRVDVHAFTLAEPAAVAAGRTAGSGDDPHGIVLGELLAGELLRHARIAELGSVQVVSVIGGRSGSTVALSASLEDRPLLEAAVRAQTQLARRVDVSRSPDQDVLVRLQRVRQEALARVAIQECPVLLCLGMLPDSCSYLASWHALGHVLAASQPGTTDAEEHLAALVATLAGQLAPSDLHLYMVAGPNTWLGQLAPLPHQQAVADPGDAAAVADLIGRLRTEVEHRQFAGGAQRGRELVLVARELADLQTSEDLAYLLAHGRRFGVRVLAATADGGLERGPLVDLFDSHLVFGLQDEEASLRLLGSPWALTLAEPGRVLVRIGRRKEVEVLGLHLTEEGRLDLLASMGIAEPTTVTAPEVREEEHQEEEPAQEQPDRNGDGVDVVVEPQSPEGATQASVEIPDLADGRAEPPPDSIPPATATALDEARPAAQSDGLVTPATGPESAVESDGGTPRTIVAPADCPERVGGLLGLAPLVVDCDEASVWSAEGRLTIGQSSPVEILLYLAAAPLLHQGRLAEWPGVNPEALLADVWAPRARDPDNRESAQTWLGKNLGRLQDELARAAGGIEAQIVLRRQGCLRLNEKVMVSDVEAFMAAIERARAAPAAEQLRVAEEAFAVRPSGLLTRVLRNPRAVGPKVDFYRWLGEPHWERAAGRLEALVRESALLMARASRDRGRQEEALTRYNEVLAEAPLERRAREGLLIAAAGTRDVIRLDQAWQQVCACLGGDDVDARLLYEKHRRELTPHSSNGKDVRSLEG